MSARLTRPAALALLLASACVDADPSGGPAGLGPGAGPGYDVIATSAAGTRGCNGADQPFAACSEHDLAARLATLTPAVSSLTRIAGARSAGALLYATAVYSASGDSTVLELDLSAPQAPVVRDLLPAGAVDALASQLLGANAQGQLGELAVLDGGTVLAVELLTRTIVAVGRNQPAILPFAGAPLAAGGFLDGPASVARFRVGPESQLCPTGDGRVFVADTGNHALRVVLGDPLLDPVGSVVTTLCGGGPATAGFADGPFAAALLDAPTGVVATCTGELLVTERGGAGEGERVRLVRITGPGAQGAALDGTVTTVAGDGVAASSAGVGAQARVADPAAPQSSGGGEAYWMDAQTGTLRRGELSGLAVDCPLTAQCAVPSQACTPGANDFAPGASFSTALTEDGALWVLQSGTTLLRRFAP